MLAPYFRTSYHQDIDTALTSGFPPNPNRPFTTYPESEMQKAQSQGPGFLLNSGGQSRNRTTDTRIFKTNHSTRIDLLTVKNCNKFSALRLPVETLPNPLPNFCGLSGAIWRYCRTASMGCAEVHRSASDIAMEPRRFPHPVPFSMPLSGTARPPRLE